jgi:SAM-dependent methyltransferase
MAFSNDSHYLRTRQYQDSSNLTARTTLHVRYSTNPYGWLRWVFNQIEQADLPPDAHIIEFGCGPGALWRDNPDRIPPGWTITLTDFSPGMVEEARQNLASGGQTFAFQVADIQSPPFETGSFDAALANHMLYHVPDRSKALDEVRRILKPNGCFFAATNGAQHMRELRELVSRFNPEFDSHRQFGVDQFNLENGLDQLAQHFAAVRLSRYEDSLRIPEFEPILTYLLSGLLENQPDEATIQQLRRAVEQTIQENGAFHVQKDAGLFSARRV